MRTTSRSDHLPTTREIREVFAEEVNALGGSVANVYDNGVLLIARAVLDAHADVRPGDSVRAGIALRALGPEALVYPYTFRLVCSNGAIAAHALEGRRVARVEDAAMLAPAYEAAVASSEIRDAIRACASPGAFAAVTSGLRSAAETGADVALQLLPFLAHLPQHAVESALPYILRRFEGGTDRSAFGLLNAVTSVARDTNDPETRWRLEELGGSMPARLVPSRPTQATTGALAAV
jgi:hypothetical protein